MTSANVFFDADKRQWPSEAGVFETALGEKVVGFFSIDKQFIDRWLTEVEDGAEKWLHFPVLKQGERIFRFVTSSCLGMTQPLVKINIDKGLVYFLEEGCEDVVIFQRRGIKVQYLRLLVDNS